jgi:hypothetical protein
MADLLEIGAADDGVGLHPRAVKRRQQKAEQNGDDADHDEEFDQGKSAATFSVSGSHAVRLSRNSPLP